MLSAKGTNERSSEVGDQFRTYCPALFCALAFILVNSPIDLIPNLARIIMSVTTEAESISKVSGNVYEVIRLVDVIHLYNDDRWSVIWFLQECLSKTENNWLKYNLANRF